MAAELALALPSGVIGRRRLGFSMLACISLLGCEREAEPAKSEPIDPFAPDAPPIFEVPLTLTVELVEPGAEPREQLRYGQRAPSRQVEMATADPDNRFDKSPMLVLIVSWSGVEVEGQTRRYIYEVVDVEGRTTSSKPDAFADFRTLAGRASGTGTGLERVSQTRGMRASPNPAEYIQMFEVPLPSEAVGLGAVWTRARTVRTEWVIYRSFERPVVVSIVTQRYTLAARDGDTLTIDYAMTEVPEDPQTSDRSSASGRLVVSLMDPLPVSVDVDATSTFSYPATADYPAGMDVTRWRHSIRTRE